MSLGTSIWKGISDVRCNVFSGVCISVSLFVDSLSLIVSRVWLASIWYCCDTYTSFSMPVHNQLIDSSKLVILLLKFDSFKLESPLPLFTELRFERESLILSSRLTRAGFSSASESQKELKSFPYEMLSIESWDVLKMALGSSFEVSNQLNSGFLPSGVWTSFSTNDATLLTSHIIFFTFFAILKFLSICVCTYSLSWSFSLLKYHWFNSS